MKALRLSFVCLCALCALSAHSLAEDTQTYLGKKIRDVVLKADTRYLEKNLERLKKEHEETAEKVWEHLKKEYPDLEQDLKAWFKKNYEEDMKKIREKRESEELDAKDLLALDKKHPDLRKKLVRFFDTKYPQVAGEIGTFLRDKDPRALREVLRLTIRMTSNVNRTVIVVEKSPEGND